MSRAAHRTASTSAHAAELVSGVLPDGVSEHAAVVASTPALDALVVQYGEACQWADYWADTRDGVAAELAGRLAPGPYGVVLARQGRPVASITRDPAATTGTATGAGSGYRVAVYGE